MAQYWTDFSSDEVDSFPSGFTHRINTTNVSSVVVEHSLKRWYRFASTSNSHKQSSFDEVDTNATVKSRIKFRIESTSGVDPDQHLFSLRVPSDGSGGYGVALRNANPSLLKIFRYTNTSTGRTQLGSATGINQFMPTQTDITLEFQADVSTIRARVDGGDGFSEWLTVTDSTWGNGGWAGPRLLLSGQIIDYESIAIGTNGDEPPTGPVETGLAIPTLIAPANAATGVILRPEFTWS